MDDWLRSLVNTALGPLRAVVAGIAARLTSLWSVISTFLGLVRQQWTNLRLRVTTWIDAQIRHAQAVALTLKWLVFTYIPRKLGALAASIQAWAAEQLSRLEAKAISLFNSVMSWAGTQIRNALGLLSTLRTWAMAQFAAILDPLGRMAKMVFGVLSTPEKLADWIVAAMFDSLVRFAKSNTHRVEAFLVSQRAAIWKFAIRIIEDIFTELL